MTAQADTTKRESVLAKVRKALDLAEGSDVQGEIDAALAQATKLMAIHAIEQAEIDALRTDGKPEQIIERRIRAGKSRSPLAMDKCRMAYAVALTNRCRMHRSFESDDNWQDWQMIVLTGYESDVDFVEMLFTSLCLQMDTAHDRAKHTKRDWVNGRTFRSEFNSGFVREARIRLEQIKKDTMAEMAEIGDGTTGTALVLVDREDAVDRWHREQNPRLVRRSSGRTNSDAHARQLGRTAATKADYSAGRTKGIGARGQIGRG